MGRGEARKGKREPLKLAPVEVANFTHPWEERRLKLVQTHGASYSASLGSSRTYKTDYEPGEPGRFLLGIGDGNKNYPSNSQFFFHDGLESALAQIANGWKKPKAYLSIWDLGLPGDKWQPYNQSLSLKFNGGIRAPRRRSKNDVLDTKVLRTRARELQEAEANLQKIGLPGILSEDYPYRYLALIAQGSGRPYVHASFRTLPSGIATIARDCARGPIRLLRVFDLYAPEAAYEVTPFLRVSTTWQGAQVSAVSS